jgi:sarcosine oxidase subunit beta
VATAQTFDVIVIGGGVAGLSTAMQLAKRGTRVIVVERQRFANGSTGRAAGFLGQLRGTREHTRMLMDGVKIVRELEARIGERIFFQTGSLRIASNEERAEEIRNLVAMGKGINFPIDLIGIDEVAKLLPYMWTDDLIEACYCPTDGHVQPAILAEAYMRVGREHGVQYVDGSPVVETLVRNGRVQGVRTLNAEYHVQCVVNAAGPWSYGVAEKASQRLAVAGVRHAYITTQPLADVPVDPMSPAVRDRQGRTYSRPELGGLLVGLYGARPVGVDTRELPADFDMSLMTTASDDENYQDLLAAARLRFPWITPNTPMKVTTGIMTFSPDALPLCGPLPGVEGLYHCSGFSGHGIVQSPVIGVIMTELLLDGKTQYDLESIAADRFWDLPGFQTRERISEQCLAMYRDYYGRVERGEGH